MNTIATKSLHFLRSQRQVCRRSCDQKTLIEFFANRNRALSSTPFKDAATTQIYFIVTSSSPPCGA